MCVREKLYFFYWEGIFGGVYLVGRIWWDVFGEAYLVGRIWCGVFGGVYLVWRILVRRIFRAYFDLRADAFD
jgi:hypothetical protein